MSLLSPDHHTLVLNHLRANNLGVLSTLHPKQPQPQSALVAFVETDQLELYFQTRSTSRKFRNLAVNRKVSFVIGWQLTDYRTLQYEGTVQFLQDAAERDACKQLFIAKDSPAVGQLEHPDTQFFRITPTWLRYSDYGAHPPVVFEAMFS